MCCLALLIIATEVECSELGGGGGGGGGDISWFTRE